MHEVAAGSSLADLVKQLGLRPEGIAIAIRYEVVPREQWGKTMLAEGEDVMLIQAVSGG